MKRTTALIAAVGSALSAAACVETGSRTAAASTAESCMKCHNGSAHDDYGGPGLENPHPFLGAELLKCTACHGGNGAGSDRDSSHVPPPPQIGDRDQRAVDREAHFNRLTLTGIDKYPDYAVGGRSYTALDYLQFVNPGDLRVVSQGRACGGCHAPHAATVGKSLLATSTGIFSGAMYAAGVDNAVPENQGLHLDTAADRAFRAVADPDYAPDPALVGSVGRLLEHPVHSRRRTAADQIFRNPAYAADLLAQDIAADNSVKTDSRLAHLYAEQVAFTCGDCHLGSAGANNRAGDYRSSGCTACHMPYSLSGRSGSRDPNVDKLEPVDPDDLDPPERSHVRSHRIASVARTLPGGEAVAGIDDHACAGCHQGSNRTVMQYWGIRLDQNQDLRNRVQYPANPVTFRTTARDGRLFDPQVGNRTFNGRNANQYIAFEDYDGDGRDDTPADVHYDAGLGCIDCHGSADLHGGAGDGRAPLMSRMEQGVAIRCESCHGTVDAEAQTVPGTGPDGRPALVAVDRKGNPIRHVVKEADGRFYLYGKLSGRRHYVRQTRHTVVDRGHLHPLTGAAVYSPRASYAMGRDDGDADTGIGPRQANSNPHGFSHMDNLSCAACHASWTNSCTGCHLIGQYDTGNNFSNITGERIVFRERNAEFVYQSPVPFQLGVGTDGKITQISPNTLTFFRYRDLNGEFSRVFAFTDRNGGGNDPTVTHPALSHNAMLAHSIRGKVSSTDEGPRYCVACHLTTASLAAYRPQYDAFRGALASRSYGALDFPLLQEHIGRNPSNQLDSPIWVHMAAGLGSGLYLFDGNGGPVNPLDPNPDRFGCDGVAPAASFDPGRVAFDLDRLVDPDGRSRGSSNHAFLTAGSSPLRDGARDPDMAGPLGATLIRRLADPDVGIVLDAWIDADGQLRGNAGTYVR